MELPQSLTPWAQYLNLFPRELSFALGALVQRIDLAVGKLRTYSLIGAGEPDGFDGLARRGDYQRLLMSEWLLAEELPDEFARRASTGEHSFLKFAHKQPTASRMSLVLFDAGPNQAGTPRLAHLAALIVMARRAEAAGARFGWGVLQQPDAAIFSEVTPTEILRLLDARTAHEATNDHLTAWRNRVSDWRNLAALSKTEDLWIVSGARLQTLSASDGLSHLCVRDVLDPLKRQLAVNVRAPSASPREITLELPEENLCTRLLRDPFQAATVAPQRITSDRAPVSNLIFDRNGAKLYARSAAGHLIVYPIPNSPRAGQGKPKVYVPRLSTPFVAVGKEGKTTFLLHEQDGALNVQRCDRKHGALLEGVYASLDPTIRFVPPKDANTLLGCWPLSGRSHWQPQALIVDGEGKLFRLTRHAAAREHANQPLTGILTLLATDVKAIAPAHSNVVYVGRENDGKFYTVIAGSGGDSFIRRTVFVDTEDEPEKVFLGYPCLSNHLTKAAVMKSTGEVKIIGEWNDASINLPSNETIESVVGTIALFRGRPVSEYLVILENDQRTLRLTSFNHEVSLPPAAAPIANVTVSTTLPVIAYSTVLGAVVVWSVQENKLLCRFIPDEPR